MALVILIFRYATLILLYLFLFHIVRLIYRGLDDTGIMETPKAEMVMLKNNGNLAGENRTLTENNMLVGYAHIYVYQGRYWLQKMGDGKFPEVNDGPVEKAMVLSTGDIINTGEMVLQFREVETCRQKPLQTSV